MRQIRFTIDVTTGSHTANLRTLDHSLASWFLKQMTKRLMEQIEAEYPEMTLTVEGEYIAACAHCGRTQMFPDEGGSLKDGSWFCCWACRKALLKKMGLVGVR